MAGSINLPVGMPLQTHKSAKQEFIAAWRDRALYSVDFSDPQVHYVALRTLGVLAAASAATLIVLSIYSIVVGGQYVIIPLCLLTSIFSFMRASVIRYQVEAKAAESLRKEIAHLSLKEVIHEYSWKQIFNRGILFPEEFSILYRQQVAPMTILQACDFYERAVKHLVNCSSPKYVYHIPLPSELRDKWEQETEKMTFEDIIKTYPLARLHDYHILSEGEFALLNELNEMYQAVKIKRDRELLHRFPQLEISKQELEKGCLEMEAIYRNDPAVRRLEVIEAEYNIKRDEIINKYAQLVKQEGDVVYASYREYTQRYSGQYLHWIKKEHREEYQALKDASAERQREINDRLERERNVEINKLKESYAVERLQLIAAAEAAKAQRDIQIGKLQEKIETAVDEQIERRFRDVVEDLNAQFAARRYILKTGF